MSVSETDAPEFDWGTLTTPGSAPEEGSPETVAEAPAEPEVEAATAPEGRPRNPDGTFAKAEPETDPEIDAILGKYGTTEKALKALAQSQSYIGQLHQTQGELQQQLAELTQAIQTPRPQQNFETLLESDPQQAAIYALTSGDKAAYERAKAEWNELAPGAPAIWEQNLQLQNEMAELRRTVAGVAAPVQEQQNLRAVAEVYQQVRSANQDFEQLQPMMGQVVEELAASGYDWISPALESGDRVKAAAALNTVVQLARARAGGNLADQARQAAVAHVQASEQAKQDAIVASASSNLGEPHEKSAGEKLWDQWGQFDIGRLRDS